MIVRRQFLILGAVMTLKCCKLSIFFFIKHNSPLKIDFWQTFKQCNIISLVNKGPKTLNLDITPHVSSVKIKIDAYCIQHKFFLKLLRRYYTGCFERNSTDLEDWSCCIFLWFRHCEVVVAELAFSILGKGSKKKKK